MCVFDRVCSWYLYDEMEGAQVQTGERKMEVDDEESATRR